MGRTGRSTGLTDKHKRFVELYTGKCNYNGRKACKELGYARPAEQARKFLDGKTYPLVCKSIERIQKENFENATLTREQILAELSNYAMLDPAELFSEDGFIINNIQDLRPEVRRCLSDFQVDTWYDEEGNPQSRIKVKINPKMEAIRLLMQHFGMLTEKHQHDLKHSIDWDSIYEEPDNLQVIEGAIAEAAEE